MTPENEMSKKFDENKWRTLAENKPDELHSYVPQSSINELFDEIERLEKENFKLKEANEDVQSRLDDYRQDYATVVNDQCPTDERHCGCVPILRRENRLISEELANAKDELRHRRDALIDAQNIYNDANNHRMRYLTALELIASFASAKDKTSIDDLVAIAGKELNCSSDRILDACNYWVMRLREEENKSKLVYVVTMYRYGDREKHSYVLGVFSNENIAHECGEKEKEYRGGKYEFEIIRFCVNSPTDFLKVKHV
jgi:hypothetical protein